MPIVPSVPDRQVLSQPLPSAGVSARVSPLEIGGGVAQGVGAVANQLQDRFLLQKQKADQVAHLDADSQLAAFDNASTNDFRNLKGRDPAKAYADYLGKYQEQVASIENTLTNDAQRLAFKESASQRILGFQRMADAHVSSQAKEYDDTAFSSFIANSHDAVQAHFSDPARVHSEVTAQIGAIEQYAARNSLPKEWTDLQVRENESKSYGNAIGRMLDGGDIQRARDTYEVWKFRIDGATQQHVEAALKEGGRQNESRSVADSILTKAPDMKAALEELEAKGIKDTGVYDQAKDRITGHFRLEEEATNQQQSNLFEQGMAQLDDPKNTEGLQGVSPSVLAGLTKPQYREALHTYAAKRAKREAPVTDWGRYYSLQARASAEQTRAAFIKEDLLVYRNELADTEFKDLVKLQSDLREKAGDKQGAAKVLSGLQTRDDVVNQTLVSIGLNPQPYTVKDGVATANAPSVQFRRLLDKAIIANQEITGKAVTPDDVQKLADKLIIQHAKKTPRGWINTLAHFGNDTAEEQVRDFQAPWADKIALTGSQVPATYRKSYLDLAAAEGKTVSEDDIITGYNADLAKQFNAGK